MIILLSDLKAFIAEAEEDGADENSTVTLNDFNTNLCIWNHADCMGVMLLQDFGGVV